MAMTATADFTASNRTTVTSPRSGLGINGLIALALGIAIVVLLVGFGGGAAASGPLEPASEQSVVVDAIEVYIVQPGDTLWDIAARITPEGGDHRATVDHLSEVAGGASLEIGQRIVIDHAAIG
jgi:hypothetical protein